jgi:hypothetical protein
MSVGFAERAIIAVQGFLLVLPIPTVTDHVRAILHHIGMNDPSRPLQFPVTETRSGRWCSLSNRETYGAWTASARCAYYNPTYRSQLIMEL